MLPIKLESSEVRKLWSEKRKLMNEKTISARGQIWFEEPSPENSEACTATYHQSWSPIQRSRRNGFDPCHRAGPNNPLSLCGQDSRLQEDELAKQVVT